MTAMSLSPAVAALVVFAGPKVPVPDSAADALAAALAIVPATAGLGWAARYEVRGRVLAVLTALGVAAMIVVHATKLPLSLVPLQVFGLLAVSHAAGSFIGRRIAHPGHILPASFVAAAADVVSVLAPRGPTNTIARSEAALPLFAIAGGVPGTAAITFVLGVGDLVMLALMAGAAAKFGVSLTRVSCLALVAFAVAIAASAFWATPVPALVPLAAVVGLGVPAFRRVAPKERRVALLAVAGSVVVVVVALVRSS
jgi:hypothetical protein